MDELLSEFRQFSETHPEFTLPRNGDVSGADAPELGGEGRHTAKLMRASERRVLHMIAGVSRNERLPTSPHTARLARWLKRLKDIDCQDRVVTEVCLTLHLQLGEITECRIVFGAEGAELSVFNTFGNDNRT